MASTPQELLQSAIAHYNAGRVAEALAAYRAVLAQSPDLREALNGLGLALVRAGNMDAAMEQWRRAVAVAPAYAEPHHNLCVALERRGQIDEAIAHGSEAVRLDPAHVLAHNALGAAMKRQGRVAEAIEHYREALRLKSDYAQAHSNLIFAYHYLPEYDRGFIFKAHVEWGKSQGLRIADCGLRNEDPNSAIRNPQSAIPAPLRVGYISPDFREHSVAYFIEPLLAGHDRARFTVTCYGDVASADAVTRRLRSHADQWRDIAGWSDERVTQLVRDDGIDILVDLAGHTARNRLLVFARRAAPVQVTYLGYPNTTGLAAMDYRLTDACADPPGSEAFHTEKLVRLPGAFLCYRPAADCPDVAPLPAPRTGHITFASFNNLAKLSPAVVELWSRILRAVPNSRLMLKASGLQDAGTLGRMRDLFAGHGIASDWLELAGFQAGHAQHMAAYGDVDIALDPFPYNGTTTTCEALWMGVPVLTLAGLSHVSRVGATLLSAVGLGELAAKDGEDLVRIAVRLAGDLPRLAAVRGTMRQRLQQSPLMNEPAFIAGVERAYEEMWRSREAAPDHSPRRESWVSVASGLSPGGAAEASPPEHAPASPGEIAAARTGAALMNEGKLAEAQQFFARAIELNPNRPEWHHNLALSFARAGDFDRAIATWTSALALRPDYADARFNMGLALSRLGRLPEALAAWAEVLRLHPDHADAHYDTGIALMKLGRYDEALAAWAQTIRYNAKHAGAHLNTGVLLQRQGRLAEAEAAYQQAVALRPSDARAHSNLLYLANYREGAQPRDIFEQHRAWARRHAEPLAPKAPAHDNNPDPSRRLRIGYVSPDFRAHSVAWFIEPILSSHDRRAVETVCYSDVAEEDDVTARLRTHAAQWRPIAGLSDQAVADLIARDRIDILVDLAGHTAGHRLLVFARKPAPVQVTYLGYPSTTGVQAIDYRLTDAWADPPGLTEKYHSETLVRLPDCFLCYSPPAAGPQPSGETPLPPGPITFGCFNNFAKVTPVVMELWARLLAEVNGSRLLLKSKGLNDAGPRGRITAFFSQRNIAPDRLELLGYEGSFQRHLECYRRIDIALDTFPYHGTTTTCEALWMGVPVVTLAGRSHVSRVGVSLLANLDLAEFITQTPADYIAVAARLAADAARRSDLRSTLRQRMLSSSLSNAARFVSALEQAYRQMWKTWCGAAAVAAHLT